MSTSTKYVLGTLALFLMLSVPMVVSFTESSQLKNVGHRSTSESTDTSIQYDDQEAVSAAKEIAKSVIPKAETGRLTADRQIEYNDLVFSDHPTVVFGNGVWRVEGKVTANYYFSQTMQGVGYVHEGLWTYSASPVTMDYKIIMSAGYRPLSVMIDTFEIVDKVRLYKR